eukprot:jgi/Botrbrau1/10443/Bobra.0133s0050.1
MLQRTGLGTCTSSTACIHKRNIAGYLISTVGFRQSNRSKRSWHSHVIRNVLVGIDLGTCNSVVAVLKDGRPTVVPVENGGFLVPSWVSINQDGEKIHIGSAAKAQGLGNPFNTFHSVKRLIGRSYHEVQADLPCLTYAVVEAFDGSAEIWCPAWKEALDPSVVSGMLLGYLIEQAQRFADDSVSGAVITVPAHFNAAQREATLAAARRAGLDHVDLLQEPVAAALAYGIQGSPQETLVLVFDLGGGTFDVAIVDAFEGMLEVIGAGGDSSLGGVDFDRAIVDWLVQRHMASGGADLRLDPLAMQRLMDGAEAAKVRLSDSAEAHLSFPFIDGVKFIDAGLSRSEFEDLTAPLRVRLGGALQALGREAHLTWAEWPPWGPSGSEPAVAASSGNGNGASTAPYSPDTENPAPPGIPPAVSPPAASGASPEEQSPVSSSTSQRFTPAPRRVSRTVLVGGGTRVPSVRALVQRATGVPPDEGLDPEQCVALGAAVRAGLLSGQIGGLEVGDGAYAADLHNRASGFLGLRQR